jgi:penicillin-binding protein 2
MATHVREHRDNLVQRLPLLQLALTAMLVLVGGSYWFVQIVHGDYYRTLAEDNRLRNLPIEAPRGLIHDRHGRRLVENVPSYNLTIDPARADDPDESLRFAAGILGQPEVELRALLERPSRAAPFQPVLLAEDLSLTQVAHFNAVALEHPEFEIDVRQVRLYRHGPHTAHVLGYLGEVAEAELQTPDSPYGAGDLVGRRGIERRYDLHLRGEDGEQVVTVDSRGRLRAESGRRPAQPGRRLDLTLDLDLQQEAAVYFEDKVGSAVVMDPDTGEILALVSAPYYNPNLFARRLDSEQWRQLIEAPNDPLQNRALQNTYPPGSVFKIVIAVAGLSESVIRPSDTVFCNGATRIYNRRFRCWRRAGHGRMNLRNAIKESCDVFFYHLGQKLGIERIADYARRFGLGTPTGLDVGGEKAGLVPDPDWSLRVRGDRWYPGETISVAIGQGPLLVTPLQIARLMATVINGGRLVVPHLSRELALPATDSGLDPDALARVQEALRAVVEERATGSAARVRGLMVGGKTGTAQVVRQKTWVDSKNLPYEMRDHAWFASFASDGQRRLVAVVFVEHGGKGSTAAAPLAKLLYETYFQPDVARSAA